MIVLSIGSIRQLAPSARMLLMLKRHCKIQLRQSVFSFSTPLGIAPYLVRISVTDFELSVGRYVVGGQTYEGEKHSNPFRPPEPQCSRRYRREDWFPQELFPGAHGGPASLASPLLAAFVFS